MANTTRQESFIDEFSRETLRILGFAERGLFLTTCFTIPLMICGNGRHAQTDVCLLDRGLMALLILQGDKAVFNASRPEPQVIAEAIAVYQYNNDIRQTRGLPTLESMTIPCIIMVGMRPTFYLVPVTRALSIAVASGLYPETSTVVVNCVTLGHTHRISEGMEMPEFRRVAFQHFVAFKNLAKEIWRTFID
ncbi:hypothetical protein BC827DRAFT_1213256 [Russula dissimulans]|nr:hypothetical protein BC827DRAFT_1213256 [Russula dissimulans]